MRFRYLLPALLIVAAPAFSRADSDSDAKALMLMSLSLNSQQPKGTHDGAPTGYSVGEPGPSGPAGPAYRWAVDPGLPQQLNLWDGSTQVGAFLPASRQYLSFSGGYWGPAAMPIALPANYAAPEVAAVQPFRDFGFHAGHKCPNCGRTNVNEHSAVGAGVHWHTCPDCNTTWWHNDPVPNLTLTNRAIGRWRR